MLAVSARIGACLSVRLLLVALVKCNAAAFACTRGDIVIAGYVAVVRVSWITLKGLKVVLEVGPVGVGGIGSLVVAAAAVGTAVVAAVDVMVSIAVANVIATASATATDTAIDIAIVIAITILL